MEQRHNWVCDAHEDTFRAVNKKLDDIVNRQIEYAETSARIEMKQEQIVRIVTNGLSDSIQDMAKKLDDFCGEVKERIGRLEEFQWFSLPVTKLRDKLFWYALKIALAGGGLYLIFYYMEGVLK